MIKAVKQPARPAPRTPALLFVLLSFICPPLYASPAGVTHALSVVVSPQTGEIEVSDTVRFQDAAAQFDFVLNAGLLPVAVDHGTLQSLESSRDGLRTAWRATLQTPGNALKLHYHGKPVFSERRGHGEMPQGIVSPEGVYLDGSSAWYPQFGQDIAAVDLAVTLPDGWEAVSIGRRRQDASGRVTWTSEVPHDELYLLAGRYTRHARAHGGIDLSVWLLDDDPALAGRYLGVMGDYIDHYSRLIGPYPYAKFAVVENRWQTGYGMPSFTLLGSRVMRLPFIPFTSLPHEILHNWWGNGVWIDYEAGNWSEGLTAYLADHWMQERQGKGGQYRLQALQRYSNFAAAGQDRPLREFVSRHSDASQSIGYSKSLMLFHMLRRELGDEAFTRGLRRLWLEHRYRRVGFAAVLATLAGGDGERLTRFEQWLDRPGAPRLRLTGVRAEPLGDGYRLHVVIRQEQDRPFSFDLPVEVTFADGQPGVRLVARVDRATERLAFDLPRRPLRVDIDPAYDVLRHLDASEQPPALNRLFGGGAWLVIPDSAPAALREAWQGLAREWQARYPGLRVTGDGELSRLDPGADRIILGWDNRALGMAAERVARADQTLTAHQALIGGRAYPADSFAVVLVNNDRDGVTTAFIGADSAAGIATLARKLPHYGSYGRLVFDGASGDNRVKDSLSSEHSTLSRQLGERPVRAGTIVSPPLGADPGGPDPTT